MSDAMFLRNMMSNSVYAEQMHSAQIQGQLAAKERAARLRQEQLKQEQAAVAKMAEAGQAGIREREENGGHAQHNLDDETVVDREDDSQEASADTDEEVRHIDLTV